ncbi:MAG: HAMP domain-containing histidine kinase, partial [Myxococcales bacterium]
MTAARLVSYVMAAQALVVLGAFAACGLGAPGLLLLDGTQARGALGQTLAMATLTEAVALTVIWRRLGRVRYALRALAMGSRAFELDELTELSALPTDVTRTTALAALGAAIALLPGPLRFDGVDLALALAVSLLAALVVVAACLPLYVLVRGAVSRALEQAPPDAAGEALALLERGEIPRQRTHLHMVAAVVVPLSFVAVGAALVAHAHVRTAVSQARIDTAIALARAVGDELPGPLPDAGLREAQRRARDEGYVVRLHEGPAPYSVVRDDDGSVEATVPIGEDHATVDLSSVGGGGVIVRAAPAALAFLVLALWGGWRLGHALADDLLGAARQVRTLGNERVLQGGAQIARPARFRVVTRLGEAVEGLADRFRVFAAAQERAIEAREASLRLRGLLFASVSHDLRSPLNAVLGFCALAGAEPLAPAQQESLQIIERRGRELLALIETILDAARAEAQQLTLDRAPVSVTRVIERALERADDLAPADAAPVEVAVDDDLPLARWDDARMAQALAALLGHARRMAPDGGVRLEATLDGEVVELLVYEPSGQFPVGEAARLLDGAAPATVPRRLGGLALGLG